jgi:chitinase
MSTVNAYGFDGVDVDDEETWNASIMTTFLSDLRAQLGSKILTATTGAGNSFNWDASHAAYMDRVNVMTYDNGSGTWNPYSWFNSPLNTPSDNCCDSVSKDIHLFITNSAVPSSKVGLGLAFYGVSSTGGGQTGPYQAFGPTPVFREINYSDIVATYPNQVGAPIFDGIGRVPWFAITGGWLNYDNPQSITEKVDYAKTNNLGGWIMWYLGADDFPSQTPPQPLLNAVKLARRPAPPTNLTISNIH